MSAWQPEGKVDVEDFLERLDMDNVRREGRFEVRFSCPYPGHARGDASASAYMNIETTAWYCHGCHRKGNAITFAASILEISPVKARRLLRDAYDPGSLSPDDRDIVEEVHQILLGHRSRGVPVPQNHVLEEDRTDVFAVDWQAVAHSDEAPEALVYMLARGFTPETLDDWELGYDARSDRVVIPVRDEHGALVGFKGRSWDGHHPKYLVIGDAPGDDRRGFGRYLPGQVVFGLNRARSQRLIVVEGELNAIALAQAGHPDAVALGRSGLTLRQARLLRSHADHLTFFFDADEGGDRGLWGWDEEDGFHHEGALEILGRDCDIDLVCGQDNDPAGYLQDGEEARIAKLIAHAKPWLRVSLERAGAA